MAEPYVLIARYTVSAGLMTAIEVYSASFLVSTTNLNTAVASALTGKTTAEDYLGQKFNLFLLVGA